MLYLITYTYYLFLLKKLNCFELYDLRAKFIIFFTILENFNKNSKDNLILFIYYNLLLKD